MSETLVVVGGGLAAGKAVEQLRTSGFTGEIVVFAAEPHAPYERPPLSKDYLLGTADLDSVYVNSDAWYIENNVMLRTGERVTAINTSTHTVWTHEGESRYDRLLLATGAQPRALPFDTAGAPVAYLRTIEDSRQLKAQLRPGKRVVLIGGGWIGLEVAAAAVLAGCEVTVIAPDALPLEKVLGPEVAAVFADLHRGKGVTLLTGARATGIETGAGVTSVQLDSGAAVEADIVVAAVGVTPDTALAEAAGLAVDNGIVLDATLATSDPEVFAAGDAASAYHPVLGRRLRVEHWDNAIAQGRVAARNMLGEGVAYERLPYFFTDQYELGMEYVGHTGDGYDQVIVRGDTSALNFTAWWLADDRVLAAMHVNNWDAIEDIRRLVGTTVGPEQLRAADSLGAIPG